MQSETYMEKSRLVQRSIMNTSNGTVQSGLDRGGGTDIPIVLVPWGACCFHCCMEVPTGSHVLWEKFDQAKDMGYGPGIKFCLPAWERISHVVSAQTISYSAPARGVPTADNILVDLNVVIQVSSKYGRDSFPRLDSSLSLPRPSSRSLTRHRPSHYPPATSHHLPPTTHYPPPSPLTAHHPPPTTHHPPSTPLHPSTQFTIPDKASAQLFVYKLGAKRLDALLAAACEEGVRALVYGSNHENVMDLASSSGSTAAIQASLTENLHKYGVTVRSMIITKTKLPTDLQTRLEKTTTMISEMENAEKQNGNDQLVIKNEGEVKLVEVEKDRDRRIQALEKDLVLLKTEAEEKVAAEEGRKNVLLENATAAQSRAALKNTHEQEMAEVQGKQFKAELVQSTTTRCAEMKVKADQDALTLISLAEAEYTVAESTAESLKEEGRAEEVAAEKLQEKRKYELMWDKLDILKDIAKTGRKVVTGERAESMMNELCNMKTAAPATMSRR
mmetsp:Transcript_72462/g.206320  ORF Transcript_72462/g.206320 Transcript_72462/m.206320 type:complete len:501 (-) Transcript_72462:319-1821(-)